jgi:hypothetical protein
MAPRQSLSRVRHDVKSFVAGRGREVGSHRVEELVGDLAPVNAGRFFFIAPMDVGQALGVARLDDV